jgi:hypothetical protein
MPQAISNHPGKQLPVIGLQAHELVSVFELGGQNESIFSRVMLRCSAGFVTHQLLHFTRRKAVSVVSLMVV